MSMLLQRVLAVLGSAAILVMAFQENALAQPAREKIVAKGERIRVQYYPATVDVQPTLWVLVEKGFCESHGLKCELVPIGSGSLGLQALASGSIEIATATTDVAMQAAYRGAQIQLIASPHPRLNFTLNIRKDIPLPNLSKGYPALMQDLKGLRVGVSGRGSGTELQLRALLTGAGMKPDDVTYVAVGAAGTAYPVFLAKQIDAAMLFEPFNALCRAQDTCVTAVDLRAGMGPSDLRALNGASSQLSTTRAFIKSNPVAVRAFIQAVEDSAAWTHDPANLDELISISKKYFSLGDTPNANEVLRSLMRVQQESAKASLDRNSVKAFSDYLWKNGLTDKPFDTKDFVYEYAPQP